MTGTRPRSISPSCSSCAQTDGTSSRSGTRASLSRPNTSGRAFRKPTAPMRITPTASHLRSAVALDDARARRPAMLRRTSSRMARRGPCGMSSRAGTASMSLAPNSRHDCESFAPMRSPVRLDVVDVVEHEARDRHVSHVVVAGRRLLGGCLDREWRAGADDACVGLPRAQALEQVEQRVAVDGRAERHRLERQSRIGDGAQLFELESIQARRGNGVEALRRAAPRASSASGAPHPAEHRPAPIRRRAQTWTRATRAPQPPQRSSAEGVPPRRTSPASTGTSTGVVTRQRSNLDWLDAHERAARAMPARPDVGGEHAEADQVAAVRKGAQLRRRKGVSGRERLGQLVEIHGHHGHHPCVI